MGQESSTNGNINNERLQTEYNNTMKEKEDYNINVNKSFYTPGMENLNKNHKVNINQTSRKIFIGKKTEFLNISNNNLTNTYNIQKNKFITKNLLEDSSFLSKDIPKYNINNTIYSEYFKCISCPMCVLIKINPKNNRVSIICENGHVNEMNIESFCSIYKYFKYICDRCKKELSSKFFYCTQCKELFCESCLKTERMTHKNHLFFNEKEVNFFCTAHKRKLVNFCNNCKKNCCKKCCSLHSSHELLLIKNEIRDINNIEEIEKLLNKEKIIIEKIEEKYPLNFFKNQNPKYLKSFNKLLSYRKQEYNLKNKIFTIYKNYINSIKANENNPTIYDSNLDISLSSISSNVSTNEFGINFLMNYYFLKSFNELENEVLTNKSDFFDISQDNKYNKDFTELKQFLFNYKKNIIAPEKNLDNFTKSCTIYQKPNFIFPLDDGNFIITYNTKIIFYDGLYGDELLILDDEIFDYTYKIIKLTDDTLLFFGDFLNHIKIEEDGDIKVLFTGSHIEILKEVVPYDNNIVFIDKITSKLNILTSKSINWHKEPFPEYSLCMEINKNDTNYDYDVSIIHNETDLNIDLNSSIMTTYNKTKKLNGINNTENKLNKSFSTININQNTKELFLNSIKNIRQEKINDKLKNNNIISNKIKTYDILSLNDSCFIALQERSINRNELCFRIFDYENEDKNYDNNIYKLMDMLYLEEEPLRKSGVLSLINNEKNNYIGYGLNDKKFFIIYDLEKKMVITKVYLNFTTYKFFGDMLLFNYQNALFQYIIKDNEFLYVTKMPLHGIIGSMIFLNNNNLLIDNKKFTYMFSYRKNNENI